MLWGCWGGGGGGGSRGRGLGALLTTWRLRSGAALLHSDPIQFDRIIQPPGEGKPKVTDEKETTVYKRALDVDYMLKLKASRCGGRSGGDLG